jgi:hypothetical protein
VLASERPACVGDHARCFVALDARTVTLKKLP